MKIATLSGACGRARIGKWRSIAVFAALLLATTNLFAATTATTVELVGGGGVPGYVDGATYEQAFFSAPCGIALDNTGEFLLIADRDNNAIRQIDLSSDETTTFTIQSISKPVGVALDSSNNVYVLNRGNGNNGTVVEFDGEFGNLIATNAAHLTNATAMALDASGNIFVTIKSNTVIRITAPGVSNVVATIPNAGAFLQGIVLKKSGSTAGLLAVCDSGRNGILLVNPTNGVVTTNAGFHGAGDFPAGSPDKDSSANARFNQPMGVVEAGDGSLIVTDYGNNRVKVVRVSDGSVTNLFGVTNADWVGPYPGFSSSAEPRLGRPPEAVKIPDTVGGVSARLPFGVALAPDGSVYVTEQYYHIIRHVAGAGFQPLPPPPPAAATGLTATAGYGQVFLTWTGSAVATNYNIKRSTSSGGETTIASTGSATPGYTDTNVLDGTTYYYVVSGLNTGGEGPNSGEASAMPLFSPAPASLIVAATNFGKISLAWSPSAGATSYNVKRSTSTNTETTIASTASLSYDDKSVVNGETYYYVVSAVNLGGENPTNSNEVSIMAPTPPPPAPTIGWFDYEGINPPVTVFHPVSGNAYTNNNDLSLAIEQNDNSGISTFYTDDGSTPSSGNGHTPPVYINGTPNFVQPLVVTPAPNLVIKAINLGPGGSSPIVTAEFVFQVGNPNVVGNNAAQFGVSNVTVGAQMFYTTDGSPPSATNGVGPINSGAILSLSFPAGVSNLTFEIRGFKNNYEPSDIVSRNFSLTNFLPNTISFGFASGPGSSKFVASAGQTFYVPVGLGLLSSAPPIYGLQFNVTITNLGSSVVNPGTINFFSLLGKPDPETPGYFLTIPPYEFISDTKPNNDPNAFQYQGDWYQNLVFADTNNEDLLGVGWLEVYDRTNLYNTKSQTLLTYPLGFGADTVSNGNQMTVGAYYFDVPLNATPGNVYQIQLGRPGGTTFAGIGLGSPVTIVAQTDTNKVGPGSINGLKDVTIGQIKYLVGSVYPANWYNAGDFGSKDLLNLDVIRVFDFAAYPIATPPTASDLFDAMDSCGNLGVLDGATGYLTNTVAYPYPTNYPGAIVDYTDTYDTNGVLTSHVPGYTANFSTLIYLTTYYVTVPYVITNIFLATPPAVPTTNIVQTNYVINVPPGNSTLLNSTLFSGNDQTINQIAFGDRVLDVCDVYVTFQRSLDTNNLVWFQRFWTNGMRVATMTNASAVIAGAFSESSGSGKMIPAVNTPVSITNTPVVNFASGDVQATVGKTIQIPVTASVVGPYPLRVAMLNISVVPLDGSPPLTTPISFSPGALGTPSSGFTASSGNGNYAVAWLNSAIAGIPSSATIGTLTITIPANATSLSAYAIHFDHASGSPNGLASLPKQTLTGLITLSSRNTSSYHDGIPDSWRLRWFGTTNNLLSVSNACPSGDGINNWKKYVAGVDPNTANDFPGLNPNTPTPSGAAMSIYWPTVNGKQYAILSSASLFPGNWTTNTTITGNGGNMEFDDHSTGAVKFYRVLILP